jgi:hypothetical protein
MSDRPALSAEDIPEWLIIPGGHTVLGTLLHSGNPILLGMDSRIRGAFDHDCTAVAFKYSTADRFSLRDTLIGWLLDHGRLVALPGPRCWVIYDSTGSAPRCEECLEWARVQSTGSRWNDPFARAHVLARMALREMMRRAIDFAFMQTMMHDAVPFERGLAELLTPALVAHYARLVVTETEVRLLGPRSNVIFSARRPV